MWVAIISYLELPQISLPGIVTFTICICIHSFTEHLWLKSILDFWQWHSAHQIMFAEIRLVFYMHLLWKFGTGIWKLQVVTSYCVLRKELANRTCLQCREEIEMNSLTSKRSLLFVFLCFLCCIAVATFLNRKCSKLPQAPTNICTCNNWLVVHPRYKSEVTSFYCRQVGLTHKPSFGLWVKLLEQQVPESNSACFKLLLCRCYSLTDVQWLLHLLDHACLVIVCSLTHAGVTPHEDVWWL